ncbi:TadE/TadG family type IV pilus assembly protein [Aquamicrobium sp. LC103]|uniref:TadE/TadG family type IV pilus assembly protein n=1 Tax=Aquamicrobium sp. LC103 TaxID=1120658 RepID=UPI0006993E4B|nr:TadE/TadG family type IV pilus assembly protein [Aquamicrobium sp. LC103]TKT82964.1 TadE/TadG family protein [Aquamicrobium sp. LC103]
MQAMRGSLRRIAARFVRSTEGNFAVMMGVVASVLALSAGYALNTAQLYHAKSNLLAALDAAVTSTARDLTTGKIEEKDARTIVEAFLLANGDRAFAGPGRVTLDSVVIDRVASTVSAQASVVVDVAFPLFGTLNRQRITTDSAALYSDKKIEVAMMLDVTGSMQGQKIRDLKTAAKNAVDAFLVGQNQADPRVRVAIVPYADAVNTGSLSNYVYVERNRNSEAEPPSASDPKAVAGGGPDRCATDREGRQQFTDADPYTAMVNRDYRLEFCPTAALRPLSADQAALKAVIDGFTANGHTAGQIGIQWSWYMLSPQWASVLPASARPQPHDPKAVAKYAILMTDGEFNTAFADVTHGQNVRDQASKSRSYAERLCSEMRKQGIEIFTVGFMLKANAKAVMRNCATPDSGGIKHYYEAATGEELDAAFQEIARNIERLALTR